MTISDKPDRYRIMLIEDIAEARDTISKALQFEMDFELVAVAKSGEEGIQLAVEHDPHVIIMDFNLPGINGIEATKIIKERLKYTEIFILSIHGDQQYMRDAMQAGVRDYLIKPPDVDELHKVVRNAAEISEKNRQESRGKGPDEEEERRFTFGRVISVYSPKGGSGCTTITTNLSVILHNAENPVAILDADFQGGDISLFFNEQGRNSIADLAPRAQDLDMNILKDVMIQHEDSGVSILAAPREPEHGDEVTEEQFKIVLEHLVRPYHYVLMDTSSYLNDITVTTLAVSNLILLVVTQEIPAIVRAVKMVALMQRLGIDRNKIMLVVNKYDKRLNITPEQIRDNLEFEDVAVIPLDERFVLPAMNRGEPFMLNNRTHTVSKSFLKLVTAIRERLVGEEVAVA